MTKYIVREWPGASIQDHMMNNETTYGTTIFPSAARSKIGANTYRFKKEQIKEKPGIDFILIFIVLFFWISAVLQGLWLNY